MPASDADPTRVIRESGQHGNRGMAAVEELYRRHAPAVLAFAQTCCRDRHTAEDLAAESFARTLQAVGAGRGALVGMETPDGAGPQPLEGACDGSARQSWELVRNDVGRIQLRNQASGLCLTYTEEWPDGAIVQQLPCGEDTRGQWWDFWHSPDSGEIVFRPIDESLSRLGLNEWNLADQPHDPTIGITRNYYNSASLRSVLEGDPFGHSGRSSLGSPKTGVRRHRGCGPSLDSTAAPRRRTRGNVQQGA